MKTNILAQDFSLINIKFNFLNVFSSNLQIKVFIQESELLSKNYEI